MQGRALWVLSNADTWWWCHVRWFGLFNIEQPAAHCECGNEPVGDTAGGSALPLSPREHPLSDTAQHPPFTCQEDSEKLVLVIALWVFESSSHC